VDSAWTPHIPHGVHAEYMGESKDLAPDDIAQGTLGIHCF
jgi:hypothetical protein